MEILVRQLNFFESSTDRLSQMISIYETITKDTGRDLMSQPSVRRLIILRDHHGEVANQKRLEIIEILRRQTHQAFSPNDV